MKYHEPINPPEARSDQLTRRQGTRFTSLSPLTLLHVVDIALEHIGRRIHCPNPHEASLERA